MKKVIVSALLLVAPSVLANTHSLPEQGLYQCDVKVVEMLGDTPVEKSSYSGAGHAKVNSDGFILNFGAMTHATGPIESNDSMTMAYDNDRQRYFLATMGSKEQNDITFIFLLRSDTRNYYFQNCVKIK
ncbi:hypothetical protein KVQ86_08445 [Escherichia coli]|uniref:hypothetical protein n=1 Tax=Escherichia coli TaxID=562 RepID=UPI00176615C9|nr:hypothetical protein [Escherichia coli]MBV7606574.1 hypothetical protein [Escherichia coli]MBV7611553.1 hypothetical protein [Escherichia coli]MBV7616276.1 hypothetical protein [Escherichia coli]HAI5968191.1 hypothetical protein [Escherichia coli]HDC8862831.1 hypothetical protein [Escherichia coli]